MKKEEVRNQLDSALIEQKKAEVHAGLLVAVLFSTLATYLYFLGIRKSVLVTTRF